MPNDVLHKIQYLCRAMPREEWSGILLYSVYGTIREPEKMAITLRDIIPMHRGSAVATGYAFNERGHDRHVDYIAANPHAINWRVGHVHSHNSMPVFFSGTDMEELVGNAASHDFYLSLIANNWNEFTAMVAVRATCTIRGEEIYTATDEEGRAYTIQSEEVERRLQRTYLHNCTVRYQKPEALKVDEAFAKAVGEVAGEGQRDRPSLPRPGERARPSDRDLRDFVADLFLSAAEGNGAETPDPPPTLEQAFALAAKADPKAIGDFVEEHYDLVYGAHFGSRRDTATYREVLGEAIFIMENHESDHPKMLTGIIDRLGEREGQGW